MDINYLDFSKFFPDEKFNRLKAGISLVSAGNMNPFIRQGRENRKRFFEDISLLSYEISFCKQIHSKHVYNADEVVLDGREGDGMVTRGEGRLLSVTAADCMPIYLYDSKNSVLGLCHSGWKGTGIAMKALEMMAEQHGTQPSDVHILLGPSIGTCCYRVDGERADHFQSEWGKSAIVERDGGYILDLQKANTNLLKQAGVENIISIDKCTCCNKEFGSFRREGPENYTRMVAYFGFVR